MAAKKSETKELQIVRMGRGEVEFCLLGITPLILNRMSEKVMRELLAPRKKTAADKAQNLKHDPMAEYRASPYLNPDATSPTLIQHLASAFKNGMAAAALDVPGSSKAQIGRLCWVEGERIDIYGVPQMMMSVTRSADMNKTPDVRTRAIVPKWACRIRVSYASPTLNATAITALVATAGLFQGAGDWRPGKGKGTYGQYEPVAEDDPRYVHLLNHGGRAVQEEAMEIPEFYDRETEELYRWFMEELGRRGRETETVATKRNGRSRKPETAAVDGE